MHAAANNHSLLQFSQWKLGTAAAGCAVAGECCIDGFDPDIPKVVVMCYCTGCVLDHDMHVCCSGHQGQQVAFWWMLPFMMVPHCCAAPVLAAFARCCCTFMSAITCMPNHLWFRPSSWSQAALWWMPPFMVGDSHGQSLCSLSFHVPEPACLSRP